MVVIAILGILAVIAVPNLIGMVNKGNDAAKIAEIATVQTAVDAYVVANNGNTPASPIQYNDIKNYLRGTLKGTYSLATNGTVIQDSYTP